MKRRIFALVLIFALFLLAIGTTALAERSNKGLYVLRPKVSLNTQKGSGRIKYLEFGTELEILSYEYDYCRVREPDGDEGYIYTGYIGYVIDRLWLTNDDGTGGVALSYWPNMRPRDLGFAAGGKRLSEIALVLYESGNYLYVVTNEGCSGYIYKYNSNIITYEEYLRRFDPEDRKVTLKEFPEEYYDYENGNG